MDGSGAPGRDYFAQLGRLARNARRALIVYISRGDTPLGAPDAGLLTPVLDYLAHVREGHATSVRWSSTSDLAEMRALVRATLYDWSWLADYGLRLAPDDRLYAPHPQAFAFSHALVTLATLPDLPPEAVTFPDARHTYADVPVPAGHGQILARIDELEHVVARSALRPARFEAVEPLRRTYGFFETCAWLVDTHLGRFGASRVAH
jgi:hypothetical protein